MPKDSQSKPETRQKGQRDSPTVPEIKVLPQTEPSEPDTPADLIVIGHPTKELLGTRHRLEPGGALIIGRAEDADIVLSGLASVSRHHARVSHLNSGVFIEDLGSTNGTWLHDCPVEGIEPLQSGDRFRVGGVHFKLLHEPDIEAAYHRAVYELMSRDPLTGCWNRRSFESELAREWPRARRYERPLSLVLFDLDQFKEINDGHGHVCGDTVLKKTADLVQTHLRAEQVLARVGGDEFAIMCPETALPNAAALAERLRGAIEGLEHSEPVDVRITCSFGVAEYSGEDWPVLYAKADQALYESKKAGGNRVSSFPLPA
jgi:diguanylate cyclase (GGDEF)-like protein